MDDKFNIWLIQTGKWFEDYNENQTCFSKRIDFDFMGAAEFEQEWDGSKLVNPLFHSLKRMSLSRDSYEFIPIPNRKDARGNILYVYCKKDYEISLVKEVIKLMDGKIQTKLSPRVNYAKASLEDLEKHRYVNFWWDIKNDFFVFYGEDKVKEINDSFDEFIETHSDIFPKKAKKNLFAKFLDLFILKDEEEA